MEVDVVKFIETGKWLIEYHGKEIRHNNPPSSVPSSHSIHRRADRTSEIRQTIVIDTKTGTRAAQTTAWLLIDNPAIAVRPRDLYNER